MARLRLRADPPATAPPPSPEAEAEAVGWPRHVWRPGEATAVAAAQAERERRAAPGAPLAIAGLRKAYGERTVLDGIDLSVARGELVAVLGANGSGKSTALRCVVGLAAPDAGSIRIEGREVVGAHGEALVAARRQAAMIFQQIHLVGRRSAIDNVCAGALGRLPLKRSLLPALFPRELREEAMACLYRVGLADRAADRVSRLSGGQQQRVAIARALCQRASVILADEPVSALDPAAAEHVMAVLADLAGNERLAVMAVLHQPDLARRHAQRLVGVLHGRIAFDAPPAAVTDEQTDALYAPERSAA